MTKMIIDYLTCGSCAQEFPLPRITEFINHKSSTCRPQSLQDYGWSTRQGTLELGPVLSCFICSQDFHTARGVLQHIQFMHNLRVFLQSVPLSISQPFLAGDTTTPFVDASPVTMTFERSSQSRIVNADSENSKNLVNAVLKIDEATEFFSPSAVFQSDCLKMASGKTSNIHYNKNYTTTIEPAPSLPENKCCSSVLPKKRKCFMGAVHITAGSNHPYHKLNSLKTITTSSEQATERDLKGMDLTEGLDPKDDLILREKSSDGENSGKENEHTCFAKSDTCKFEDHHCRLGQDDKVSGSKGRKAQIFNLDNNIVNSKKTYASQSDISNSVIAQKTVSITVDDSCKLDHNICCVIAPTNTSPELVAESAQNDEIDKESACMLDVYNTVSGKHCKHSTTNHLCSQADTPLSPNASVMKNIFQFGKKLPVNASQNLSTSEFKQKLASGASPSSQSLTVIGSSPQFSVLDTLTSSLGLFDSLEHVTKSGAPVLKQNDVSVQSGRCNDLSDSFTGSSGMEEDWEQGRSGKRRKYPTSRPFKCDACDKAFNQRIHLKKHTSKHTGVKPFKCGDCDYSTVERSHLRAHVRIHTGEKPFSCNHCNYATAQNSTLKIHLKRHHSDRDNFVPASLPQTVPVVLQTIPPVLQTVPNAGQKKLEQCISNNLPYEGVSMKLLN